MTMLRIILTSSFMFLVLPGLVTAEEQKEGEPTTVEKKFYKTIGPDGQVIYTDKPVKDSTEIKVPKGTTYKPVVTPDISPSNAQPAREPFEYESLVITSPSQKETIWSNEGKLDVGVSLVPSLRISHSITVSVDGKILARGKSLTIPLSNIDPGEHELKVEVQETSGQSLKSETAVFYMKRHVVKQTPGPVPAPHKKP